MRRAIILAHFDRHGVVDPYVGAALAAYRSVADRLVLVSTTVGRLPGELAGVVDLFVPRVNEGYDFGSWRAGLEALGDTTAFDEVVCVNDSVYGPLWDPAAAFAHPRVAGADFWGMVRSDQSPASRAGRRCAHLQSWFFAARRRLLDHPAWRRFWEDVVPQPSKERVIDRYELGLSEMVAAAGLSTAAVFDGTRAGRLSAGEILPHLSLGDPLRSWKHLRKARRLPHNPSELAYRRLLAAGVPYVKVGLFRTNHYRLDLGRVRRDLREIGCDLGLVDRHIERVAA